MIYIPELDQSFDSFDDLLYWFCSDFPSDDDTIANEAQVFIKHHFPLIDLSKFWVTCLSYTTKEDGYLANEFTLNYNKDELRRCYPEYFI